MFEDQVDTFRDLMKSFSHFIIFIFLLCAVYFLVSGMLRNSLTGNLFTDGLLIVVPIVFAGAVLFIMYKKYVGDE